MYVGVGVMKDYKLKLMDLNDSSRLTHLDWVVWGPGTPNDRDEVNR